MVCTTTQTLKVGSRCWPYTPVGRARRLPCGTCNRISYHQPARCSSMVGGVFTRSFGESSEGAPTSGIRQVIDARFYDHLSLSRRLRVQSLRHHLQS